MNISLAAEPIFHLGSFPVTNTLIMSWLIVLVLIIFTFILKNRIKEIPTGIQNAVEAVFEALINFMDSVTHDHEKSKKFFPLIATIFIFVILSNWIEVVPGLGTIGIYEHIHGKEVLVPFIRSSSADLNVTLAIALISVIGTQIFGATLLGFSKHLKKYISLNPLYTFVGILEIFAELAKILSFSFRLFGNIFAGEVLLIVVSNLVPYVAPLPFLLLEIFVGFIQALIFSTLTLVFLTMATTEAAH
ncbi:ATP synthase F0 subunit A [Candidatus Parcubacteria bacterium]|nr:MAG: ATP synthase F0 subunit A [Candidatus Parcubacteria bacterium]